ncbi:MAG: hypothetical protein AB7S72_15470 [Draconibacterium sp.]
MKKLILLPFLFAVVIGFAQSQFVVQNDSTRVFYNINDAFTAANAGDTIYIPGGSFTLTNGTITKTLHLVGVGHYPAYAGANGTSRITTSLNFTGTCDGSSMEGIEFTGPVTFGTNGDEAENIRIKRCKVNNPLYLRVSATGNPVINTHITESVLNLVDARYGANCLVEKCLIFSDIYSFYQSVFINNNINVIGYMDRLYYYCTNCTFTNNIFSNSHEPYSSNSCEFHYNLFAKALTFSGTNSGSNNITNVGTDNIFTTITGSINLFSYDNNYHLKEGCPGIGAAEDGTDMGIYGTAVPYKEGAVPFYPLVTRFNVENEATNGMVGTKITVVAQER